MLLACAAPSRASVMHGATQTTRPARRSSPSVVLAESSAYPPHGAGSASPFQNADRRPRVSRLDVSSVCERRGGRFAGRPPFRLSATCGGRLWGRAHAAVRVQCCSALGSRAALVQRSACGRSGATAGARPLRHPGGRPLHDLVHAANCPSGVNSERSSLCRTNSASRPPS
jgi:hypothetical protein